MMHTLSSQPRSRLPRLAGALAAATLALAASSASAADVVVDVKGAQSINLLGETGNTVWFIDVGPGALIQGLSWQVQLQSLAPSQLSEMQVSFGDASGLTQFTLTPGALDLGSGTGSYTGHLDLQGLGVTVGADGRLRLEFSEAYKDFDTGLAEGQWLGGRLSFQVAAVPEPASHALALLGLAVVGWRLRRRA